MNDDAAELEIEPVAPHSVDVGYDPRTRAKAAVVGGLANMGANGAIGAGVASGGGGLAGGVVSKRLDRCHVENVNQGLTRDRLLLWVHSANRDREFRAPDFEAPSGARRS